MAKGGAGAASSHFPKFSTVLQEKSCGFGVLQWLLHPLSCLSPVDLLVCAPRCQALSSQRPAEWPIICWSVLLQHPFAGSHHECCAVAIAEGLEERDAEVMLRSVQRRSFLQVQELMPV